MRALRVDLSSCDPHPPWTKLSGSNSGYTDKAAPAYWHTVYPMLLDGILLDGLTSSLWLGGKLMHPEGSLREIGWTGDESGDRVEERIFETGGCVRAWPVRLEESS